jgi:hypothetical protein
MPASRIIYWETSRRTPDKVTARLVFPDKATRDYKVEALKVLERCNPENEADAPPSRTILQGWAWWRDRLCQTKRRKRV